MSKFYTLLLTLTSFFALTAQDTACDDTLLSHTGNSLYVTPVDTADFEVMSFDYDGLPLISGLGGDPDSFKLWQSSDENVFYMAYSFFDTAGYAAGSNNLTAANALYFSGITIPEGGAKLSWKHEMLDNDYRDGYMIFISGNDSLMGLHSIIDNDASTDGDTTFTAQEIEINDEYFNGSKVSIIFYHNAYYAFGLKLDDITLTGCISNDDTTVTDTTIIDDTTSNSDTVIIIDTTSNSDTVVVVDGDTVFTTIYDTIIITETIEVPGDNITATIVIDIEGTCNDISTGITEGDFIANELTAYPNPVIDVLNIQINNTSSISGSFTLNIYAIDGSLVKTETISSTATVDLSSLEAGFHVIEVIGANEVLAHQKFLKN
jgi:hypothetical protein